MSSKFIESEHGEEELSEAEENYPGSAKIIEVYGGYYVFDSINDYEIWINQK